MLHCHQVCRYSSSRNNFIGLHSLSILTYCSFNYNPVWCTLSDPPQIFIRPNQRIVVDAGNTITFVCVVDRDSNPFISWNRGDTAASNNSRITTYEELVTEMGVTFVLSILELCSAEQADNGQYTCFAENTFGNNIASFVLTVNAESKQQYNICSW